jgi:hypothetical protein
MEVVHRLHHALDFRAFLDGSLLEFISYELDPRRTGEAATDAPTRADGDAEAERV